MEAKSKFHYGWIMCIVGVLVVFFNTGCVVNSVYNPYFLENGLSNTDASLVVTVRTAATVIAMFLCSQFYKKISLRLGLFIFTVAGAGGMVMYGVADSFIMYAAGAALAGICHGLAGNIPVSMLTNSWFEAKKNLVYGITMAASGFTSVVLPPTVTALAGSMGFTSTMMIVGAAFAVVAVLCLLLVRDRPELMGFQIYGKGAGEEDKEKQPKKEKKVSKLKRPVGSYAPSQLHMILICAVSFIMGGQLYSTWSHLSVLFSTAGFEPAQYALLLSMAGFALMAGKVIFGILCDATNAEISFIIFAGLQACGLIINTIAAATLNYGLAFVGCMLEGGAGVGSTSALASVTSELYPEEKIYRGKLVLFTLVYNIGGLVLSPLFGITADMTGSYGPIFIAMAVLGFISMFLTKFAFSGALKRAKALRAA